MSVITLLSDFGLEDGYVAAMKGVVATIAPEAHLVDITHLVPAQDIASARFRLQTVSRFFPPGTVHLAVVDPGVGTARRAIAVRSRSGSFFVGPDNGLLTGALDADSPAAAVELSETRFWRTPAPSATFHGRDVFAPAAAYLARGTPMEALGRAIDPTELVRLELPACETAPNGFIGAIQAVDRFGNLITNVPGSLLTGRRGWTVSIAGRSISGHRTYADVPPGELVALVGSHEFVEVAVNRGDARQTLRVGIGDPVQVGNG
jgi:S-adenosyl-L-methionine hydrolase (adenosine-forming)